MKNNRLYILLILTFFFSISAIYSQNFIEPGKTWTYLSYMAFNRHGPYRPFSPHKVALTLGEPEEIEGEDWTPCFGVDTLGNKLIDIPLAHLKEEDRRVFVRPNNDVMSVRRLFDDMESKEEEMLFEFLPYYSGGMDGEKYEGTFFWNSEFEKDFLLYDFNFQIGDSYKWPWSGINFPYEYFSPNKDRKPMTQERGYYVTEIEEECFKDSKGAERKRKIYHLKQAEEDFITHDFLSNEGIILEGIGLVDSDFSEYYLDLLPCTGYFITPNASCIANFSSYFSQSTPPKLISVTTADGTVIYENNEDEEETNSVMEIESNKEPEIEKIFDLHGRQITSPLPSSIYIRNGKKYIMK